MKRFLALTAVVAVAVMTSAFSAAAQGLSNPNLIWDVNDCHGGDVDGWFAYSGANYATDPAGEDDGNANFQQDFCAGGGAVTFTYLGDNAQYNDYAGVWFRWPDNEARDNSDKAGVWVSYTLTGSTPTYIAIKSLDRYNGGTLTEDNEYRFQIPAGVNLTHFFPFNNFSQSPGWGTAVSLQTVLQNTGGFQFAVDGIESPTTTLTISYVGWEAPPTVASLNAVAIGGVSIGGIGSLENPDDAKFESGADFFVKRASAVELDNDWFHYEVKAAGITNPTTGAFTENITFNFNLSNTSIVQYGVWCPERDSWQQGYGTINGGTVIVPQNELPENGCNINFMDPDYNNIAKVKVSNIAKTVVTVVEAGANEGVALKFTTDGGATYPAEIAWAEFSDNGNGVKSYTYFWDYDVSSPPAIPATRINVAVTVDGTPRRRAAVTEARSNGLSILGDIFLENDNTGEYWIGEPNIYEYTITYTNGSTLLTSVAADGKTFEGVSGIAVPGEFRIDPAASFAVRKAPEYSAEHQDYEVWAANVTGGIYDNGITFTFDESFYKIIAYGVWTNNPALVDGGNDGRWQVGKNGAAVNGVVTVDGDELDPNFESSVGFFINGFDYYNGNPGWEELVKVYVKPAAKTVVSVNGVANPREGVDLTFANKNSVGEDYHHQVAWAEFSHNGEDGGRSYVYFWDWSALVEDGGGDYYPARIDVTARVDKGLTAARRAEVTAAASNGVAISGLLLSEDAAAETYTGAFPLDNPHVFEFEISYKPNLDEIEIPVLKSVAVAGTVIGGIDGLEDFGEFKLDPSANFTVGVGPEDKVIGREWDYEVWVTGSVDADGNPALFENDIVFTFDDAAIASYGVRGKDDAEPDYTVTGSVDTDANAVTVAGADLSDWCVVNFRLADEENAAIRVLVRSAAKAVVTVKGATGGEGVNLGFTNDYGATFPHTVAWAEFDDNGGVKSYTYFWNWERVEEGGGAVNSGARMRIDILDNAKSDIQTRIVTISALYDGKPYEEILYRADGPSLKNDGALLTLPTVYEYGIAFSDQIPKLTDVTVGGATVGGIDAVSSPNFLITAPGANFAVRTPYEGEMTHISQNVLIANLEVDGDGSAVFTEDITLTFTGVGETPISGYSVWHPGRDPAIAWVSPSDVAGSVENNVVTVSKDDLSEAAVIQIYLGGNITDHVAIIRVKSAAKTVVTAKNADGSEEVQLTYSPGDFIAWDKFDGGAGGVKSYINFSEWGAEATLGIRIWGTPSGDLRGRKVLMTQAPDEAEFYRNWDDGSMRINGFALAGPGVYEYEFTFGAAIPEISSVTIGGATVGGIEEVAPGGSKFGPETDFAVYSLTGDELQWQTHDIRVSGLEVDNGSAVFAEDIIITFTGENAGRIIGYGVWQPDPTGDGGTFIEMDAVNGTVSHTDGVATVTVAAADLTERSNISFYLEGNTSDQAAGIVVKSAAKTTVTVKDGVWQEDDAVEVEFLRPGIGEYPYVFHNEVVNNANGWSYTYFADEWQNVTLRLLERNSNKIEQDQLLNEIAAVTGALVNGEPFPGYIAFNRPDANGTGSPLSANIPLGEPASYSFEVTFNRDNALPILKDIAIGDATFSNVNTVAHTDRIDNFDESVALRKTGDATYEVWAIGGGRDFAFTFNELGVKVDSYRILANGALGAVVRGGAGDGVISVPATSLSSGNSIYFYTAGNTADHVAAVRVITNIAKVTVAVDGIIPGDGDDISVQFGTSATQETSLGYSDFADGKYVTFRTGDNIGSGNRINVIVTEGENRKATLVVTEGEGENMTTQVLGDDYIIQNGVYRIYVLATTQYSVKVTYDYILDPQLYAVKKALVWDAVRNSNTAQNDVTTNLISLPTSGSFVTAGYCADGACDDVEITWTSTVPSVVSTTGAVTRPAWNTADAAVTLTATVSKAGEEPEEVVFELIVPKWLPFPEDFITLVKDGLNWELIKGGNDQQTGVTEALALPLTGSFVDESVCPSFCTQVTIEWSSVPAGVVNNATGAVTRPAWKAGDADVELTATVAYSTASDSVKFALTVTKLDATEAELAEAAAEAFKAAHKSILDKTVVTVAIADRPLAEEALGDYAGLDNLVKALLTTEKTLLDGLLVRIVELEVEAANVAAANAFKTAHAAILAKTAATVVIGDKDAVNAAITAHGALSSDVRALLTTEKTLLDGLFAKIVELEVEAANVAAANAFKAAHAAILGKTVATVAIGDKAAVDAAIAAHAALTADVRALLTTEKTLLDNLLVRIGELEVEAANVAAANAFKAAHAAILGKTAATVVIGDKAAVTAAQTAYDALAAVVRALLTTEKTLLDGLLAKIGELEAAKAADDADITAAKGLVEGAPYTATQANVTNIGEARAAVTAVIAALNLKGVSAAVVDGAFNAAVAGSQATPAGVNGSYAFTVNLNKGAGTPQTTASRTLTITATQHTSSILVSDRTPPVRPSEETAVVAPVSALAAGFTAGPNIIRRGDGVVKIYRVGAAIGRPRSAGDNVLTVYDATGNVITKISVSENAPVPTLSQTSPDNGNNRRTVGSWDLRDGKGRPVAEGTYLLKGTVTVGGKRERVSLPVSVR